MSEFFICKSSIWKLVTFNVFLCSCRCLFPYLCVCPCLCAYPCLYVCPASISPVADPSVRCHVAACPVRPWAAVEGPFLGDRVVSGSRYVAAAVPAIDSLAAGVLRWGPALEPRASSAESDCHVGRRPAALESEILKTSLYPGRNSRQAIRPDHPRHAIPTAVAPRGTAEASVHGR